MLDKVLHIDPEKPAMGRDLLHLRTVHGITFDEIRAIFGLSGNTFNAVAKDGMNAPIQNASIALLLRFYAENPDAFPVLPSVSLEQMVTVSGLQPKEVVLILGKEQTSMFRWGKMDNRTPATMIPVVRRLCLHFYNEMKGYYDQIVALEAEAASDAIDEKTRKALLDKIDNLKLQRTLAANKWKKRAEVESKARGVENIWETGNWNTDVVKSEYKRIVEEEKAAKKKS